MSTDYRMIFNQLEYFCFEIFCFSFEIFCGHYFVCSLQQSHTSHGSRGTLMTPLTDERSASSWGILRPRGGNVQHCASTTPAPDEQRWCRSTHGQASLRREGAGQKHGEASQRCARKTRPTRVRQATSGKAEATDAGWSKDSTPYISSPASDSSQSTRARFGKNTLSLKIALTIGLFF